MSLNQQLVYCYNGRDELLWHRWSNPQARDIYCLILCRNSLPAPVLASQGMMERIADVRVHIGIHLQNVVERSEV